MASITTSPGFISPRRGDTFIMFFDTDNPDDIDSAGSASQAILEELGPPILDETGAPLLNG